MYYYILQTDTTRQLEKLDRVREGSGKLPYDVFCLVITIVLLTTLIHYLFVESIYFYDVEMDIYWVPTVQFLVDLYMCFCVHGME